MTTIIFFSKELHDCIAPGRTLMLQAGRGGDPELFWLSNGSKYVSLDHIQASEFLNALRKMNACVQAGRLSDHDFYSGDIQSYDGKTLGVDLGIRVGRPFIGVEDTRIDVSPDDLNYFANACRQAHHLAGGVSPAARVARTPRTYQGPQFARPTWENFASRFCNNGMKPWYDED